METVLIFSKNVCFFWNFLEINHLSFLAHFWAKFRVSGSLPRRSEVPSAVQPGGCFSWPLWRGRCLDWRRIGPRETMEICGKSWFPASHAADYQRLCGTHIRQDGTMTKCFCYDFNKTCHDKYEPKWNELKWSTIQNGIAPPEIMRTHWNEGSKQQSSGQRV